jgi:hypothetical protein
MVASAWGIMFLEPYGTNAFNRGVKSLPDLLGVMSWLIEYVSALPRGADKSKMLPPQCGGSRHPPLTYSVIQPFLRGSVVSLGPHTKFIFVDHVRASMLQKYAGPLFLPIHIPLDVLLDFIPVATARKIATMHRIEARGRATVATLRQCFKDHVCETCDSLTTVLAVEAATTNEPIAVPHFVTTEPPQHLEVFPPQPLNRSQEQQILLAACQSMDKRFIEESGCAICGILTPSTHLSPLSAIKNCLHVLAAPGVSRAERTKKTDKLTDLPIVIDDSCDQVCLSCRAAVRKNKVPRFALARGLWIGAIPAELACLRYIERLLVARVRHNCCCVRVASGMRKMKANAIAFLAPVPKIYNMLPPPREDIQEVLAIMFTGPCKPTAEDFKRTPFLVRRNHVKRALIWLLLNHADYADISISDKNLAEYPENMPPVSVEYKKMDSNKTAEGVSLFDLDEEDGTEEGDCPFTVHGLTGGDMETMSTNALKAKALRHLNGQGKILAVGHAEGAETIWKNPQLYPQMFPWLFPYGLGGVGSVNKISEKQHKKHLLMYHDKRFQTDPNFPFIAFSHEQIKASATKGFLLADKHVFGDIANRLLTINNEALSSMIDRLAEDQAVRPQTSEERQCVQLLRDLDHVQGAMKGTNTCKKWMRNEIWSLVYHCGAPFWYITLSPADVKHPVCIYFASSQEKFQPEILPYEDRLRMVCQNPVACARFFHFVVTIFVKDVLGVDSKHAGAYGPVSAYYGTVEQQGRLALHLHMAVWLRGNLTPQEMRSNILNPTSDFRQKIIAWVESCQVGEFLTGSQTAVLLECNRASAVPGYQDPTQLMPAPPPPLCTRRHVNDRACPDCEAVEKWWQIFPFTVDDLVSKSNIHNCARGSTKNGLKNKKAMYVGCKDNRYGKCRARFPRPFHEKSEVDPETGSITLKKLEPWINTFSPLLTYLMRCNTDVSCIWSGTAVKAVLVYITDYITKSGLKTHVVFETIKSIFDKHREVIFGTLPDKEKARILMTKMVNLLSTKLEMGAPMVCMYLLDNPDHYTNHRFVPFYWESFVKEAQCAWDSTNAENPVHSLAIVKKKEKIVGLSPVFDYIYRPEQIEDMCLYDWVRRCEKRKLKLPPVTQRNEISEMNVDDDVEIATSASLALEDEAISDASVETGDLWPEATQRYAFTLPKNVYRYGQKHPLFDTHGTMVKSDNANIVVNFIGRPLPRCDRGDREYYCLAMLVLFKPWRSGLQLKEQSLSWDEAFLSHKFTERQQQLVSNFNIKYECLDARDDYSAKMRKNCEDIFNDFPENLGHNVDVFDHIDAENVTSDIHDNDPGGDIDISLLGVTERRRRKDMQDIRLVMERTGWTSGQHTELADPTCNTFQPLKHLSGSEWKSQIQQLRQEALDDRQKSRATGETVTFNMAVAETNVVRIIDRSHLEKRHHSVQHRCEIDKVSQQFHLNEEQERAFKIIANHSVIPSPAQLKMYIGGMGGTGKSQVLKAICAFFSQCNENHRFLVVAPTGSAAALLAGSTYHSMLGINEKTGTTSNKVLAQVRSRLAGVTYIFLDEVSMLSCHSMYKISAQLCKVLNRPEIAFGGMNMIFAGDFGQLPPPMGGENVSLYSRVVGQSATSLHAQEEAMGRALWHQVTSVVMLRKNMRQQSCSIQDDMLRSALENLRYKDCKSADIQFLQSRISSFKMGKVSICDARFNNVAIITAKNVQKDEINRLGCIKFATQTKQTLTHFFSEDMLKTADDDGCKQRFWKKGLRHIKTISDSLQKALWEMPHSSADKHVAGTLSLCIGLPIMIKCNVATELCITNGQEATVAGWQTCLGLKGQLMLDTLFVTLVNPPANIQLSGLPVNTVPLTSTVNNITCTLPDDTKIQISRTQVEILPNFAMTDYASQGKTRPHNAVDLSNCRTHQAYYTALSRGATAAGTVILQGFDLKKITGKASGALRQEFRDLELLDEITRLKYESKLHNSVMGERRNTLIHTYRLHRGLEYVPAAVHASIAWSNRDPMLDPIHDDLEWKMVEKINAKNKFSHVSKPEAKKRHLLINNEDHLKDKRIVKKGRYVVPEKRGVAVIDSSVPLGLAWYQNSCAYDATVTILHALWSCNPAHWTVVFKTLNMELLGKLAIDFGRCGSSTFTLDSARDNLRRRFMLTAPALFGWGELTSMDQLLRYLFDTPFSTLTSCLICTQHHLVESSAQIAGTCCVLSAGTVSHSSISSWVSNMMESTQHICAHCYGPVQMRFNFCRPWPLIAFEFAWQSPEINVHIVVCVNGVEIQYSLAGVVYFGHEHFTCRLISSAGLVWFHDGITTGQSVINEGHVNTVGSLSICRGKQAAVAIYAMLP